MSLLSSDLIWWISAIDVPVLSGLFLLIMKTRRENDEALDQMRHLADTGHAQLRESLSAYKLEVAKSYASIGYIKDVERRLISQLSRIEAKLDSGAFRADLLRGEIVFAAGEDGQ